MVEHTRKQGLCAHNYGKCKECNKLRIKLQNANNALPQSEVYHCYFYVIHMDQLNFASLFGFRATFSEFAAKHARDARFKAIEKMKDREAIFNEFMTSLRKKEKENSKNRGEKVSMISMSLNYHNR